ncbi:MAG: type II secretion system protein N [Steroidobacteraceae bacterium]
MRRIVLMSVAALLVFAIVLCARLPTSWAARFFPANVQCIGPEGSIWNGGCAQLTVQNIALGTAQWQVARAALLRGALSATARFQRADGQLSGRFELRMSGRIEANDLRGDLPLDPALITALPANWTGRLQLDIPRLTMHDEQVELIQGVIRVRDIIANGPRPDAFGSYELRVRDPPDAAGRIHGRLRDLDGPYSLDADLALERGGIWDVKGTIAANAGASDSVRRQIEILGSPDAAGRRNFSLSNRP